MGSARQECPGWEAGAVSSVELGWTHTGSSPGSSSGSAGSSWSVLGGPLLSWDNKKFLCTPLGGGWALSELLLPVPCSVPRRCYPHSRKVPSGSLTSHAWHWVQCGSVLYHNLMGWKEVSQCFVLFCFFLRLEILINFFLLLRVCTFSYIFQGRENAHLTAVDKTWNFR